MNGTKAQAEGLGMGIPSVTAWRAAGENRSHSPSLQSSGAPLLVGSPGLIGTQEDADTGHEQDRTGGGRTGPA